MQMLPSITRLLLLALLVSGCRSMTPLTADPVQRPAVAPGFPHYQGRVAIDPASGQLTARWSILVHPRGTERDSVTLLLAQGMTVSHVGGAHVSGFTTAVRSGLRAVTVHLAPPLPADRVARIEIEYAGSPQFGSDGINAIQPDWIELGLDSFWFPVFSGFDHRLTADVQLLVPGRWEFVTSGAAVASDSAITIRNTVPQVDIAFAGAPELTTAHFGSGTIHHVGTVAGLGRVQRTAEACAVYLDERFGAARPLPSTRIVIAPRSGPGYAREQYIVITAPASFSDAGLTGFLCHEFSHFWSSANSQGPDNWLNEGIATYIASRAVRALHGDAAYAQLIEEWTARSAGLPPVWTPQATMRPPHGVSYRKAPLLMHRLEARVGETAMDRILARYAVDRIASTRDLLGAIADVAGADAASWLEGELAR